MPDELPRKSAPRAADASAHDNRGYRAGRPSPHDLPHPDPAFHWTREAWGAALRCRALDPHAQHLFTSRQLALPGHEAWQAALASAGAPGAPLMRVKQVHGNTVRVLRRDAVPADASDVRPEADALVSNQAGLALAVMVADCVPIILVDPVRRAAAVIHAGWRGTCARIAARTIEVMQRECETAPEDVVAAIGPSAGPWDYEVGPSLIDAFREAGHESRDLERWFLETDPRPHLDLWQANRDQLAAAGVPGDHIYICGLSTVAHPQILESYRRDGEQAGRMAALVVVPACRD
jgi:YfiH family protein